MMTETIAAAYTDQEATDEAVLLLTRKLRRLHPAAYADLMRKLPKGAQLALSMAESRADRVRDEDRKTDTGTREYPNPFADIEDED